MESRPQNTEFRDTEIFTQAEVYSIFSKFIE